MARCAVGGRGEVHVAAPSPAATGDHHSLSSSEQLPNRLAALTAHDRPGRNAEHQIGAVPAVRAPPPTTSTWFGAEMPRLAVVPQRGHPGLGHEHDVPAPAAVAPVGAAARHVSLAAKRGGSSPAAAGGNEHPCMVDSVANGLAHVSEDGRVDPREHRAGV